jgi:hypothetical protein
MGKYIFTESQLKMIEQSLKKDEVKEEGKRILKKHLSNPNRKTKKKTQ